VAIHASRYSRRRSARSVGSKRETSKKRRGVGGKVTAFFFLVILIGLGYLSFGLVQPFPKLPKQKDYPVSVNYNDRINILLSRIDGGEVKYLAVVSLAEGDRTRIINLDPDMVARIPGGKGEYRIAISLKLGETDGMNGMNLLMDAASRMIASPIDGYVVAGSSGWGEVRNIYGADTQTLWSTLSSVIGKTSIAWQGLPRDVYTSFSKLEFAKMSATDYGLIEVVDTGRFVSSQTVDGSGFDSGSFDAQVGDYFNEKGIVRNHPRVSIVNASGISGAGLEMERYVHNMGGEVVTVSTADKTIKATSILDHLGGSTLSSRLMQIMRCGVMTDKKLSQADIEVTIGEDAKNWY
jgi:hypothetical protein